MSDGSTEVALKGFLAGHAPVAGPEVLRHGDEVDGWRVAGFLGRGGNGEVYRVEATVGGVVAALKILVKDDSSARGRFALEGDILSEVDCPALPNLLCKGMLGNHPYIITELLEPVEMPETDKEVASYVLGICSAVAALHAHGIVHRDIKPQNVMRRSNGSLVLIDVGLAKGVEDPRPRDGISIVSGRAVAVGTPGYAAPEQLIGGVVSPLTDIHALGRLVDVCFAGHPPGAWKEIVRRSTSSIPEQRYKSVEDFAQAIRNRNRGRRLAGWGVALGIVAMLSLAMSFWWRMGGRERIMWGMLCENVATNEIRRELLWQRSMTNNVLDAEAQSEVFARYREVTNQVICTVIRLKGRKHVFKMPLALGEGREYRIVGPWILDAQLRSSASNTVVRLSGCMMLNRSDEPLDKSAICYYLENGAYLNFTALDKPFDSRDISKHVTHGRGETECLFKGPETWRDLNRLRERRVFDRIR